MTKRSDIITTAVCLLIGGLIFWDTNGYPTVQGQGFGQGPAFYPRLLAAGLMLFGLFSLSSLFDTRIDKDTAVPQDDAPVEKVVIRPFLPFLVLLLTVLFVVALPWLGFIPGGLVLVAVTAQLIRKELSGAALLTSLAAGVGIMLLIWLIFSFAIGIELPASRIF